MSSIVLRSTVLDSPPAAVARPNWVADGGAFADHGFAAV